MVEVEVVIGSTVVVEDGGGGGLSKTQSSLHSCTSL